MTILRAFKEHREWITGGSHLALLVPVVMQSSGPIVELGCGLWSTPVLHWACYQRKRPLHTYENNERFNDFVNLFRSDYHQVSIVPDYTSIVFPDPCGVAFVDQVPEYSRKDTIRMLTHAEYVVIHDTNPGQRRSKQYSFEQIWDLFNYRFDLGPSPGTTVVSNVHDVEKAFS